MKPEITYKDTMTNRLKLYKKRLNINGKPGTDYNAKLKLGLQLLNWIVNGSSSSSRVPPILTGVLRGSGTVFVGKYKVGDMKDKYRNGTPANTYDGKMDTITVGFNTIYAVRWHEEKFKPGKFSVQSGDVGNKYVEQHIKADGKALTKMYANIMKKEQNV